MDPIQHEALGLCQQHLKGEWKESSASEVQIHKIEGGASNRIFSCQLYHGSGQKVVVRLYGSCLTQEGSHRYMDEAMELEIVSRLAQKGLHPNILASFPGGRIEEFIHGRPVRREEIKDHDEFNSLVMTKLAHIHSMTDMPTREDTVFSFDMMQSFIDKYRSQGEFDFEKESDADIYSQDISHFDFEQERNWLQQMFRDIPTRDLFCHTDFHRGNFLILQEADSNNNSDQGSGSPPLSLRDIFVIDYEFSGRNVRWGDLAYYFVDLTCSNYDPETGSAPSGDPINTEIMSKLIAVYLKEWKSKMGKDNIDPDLDTCEHILKEVRVGRLCIHLMFVLFFLAFVRRNYDDLHCWKYTRFRLQCYLKEKDYLLTQVES